MYSVKTRKRIQSLRGTLRIVAMVAPLAIAACATTPSKTPQEQVRERATQRWSQMMAKNFEKAYSFTTAGFKAVVKPEDYRNRFGAAGLWRGAEIVRVDCPEDAKCIARISLSVKSPLKNKEDDVFKSGIDEIWLLEGGKWFLYEDARGN